MVTCALGRSMKKAGMRVPYDVSSQKCRDGWMYVGGGGWNSSELIMSPIVLFMYLFGEMIPAMQHEVSSSGPVWRRR